MSDEQLSQDPIREFVIASHGNLPKVQAMLAEFPALLNAAYEWKTDDTETAIQAAAHVGAAEVAGYLLSHGAPLAIYTAAMLGRTDDVQRLLDQDSVRIHATGAHGIPLLTHAAWSGDLALAQMLFERGARAGVSAALFNAVSRQHAALTSWLLENGRPDLSWRSFQDQTALEHARQRGYGEIVDLLQAHGAG